MTVKQFNLKAIIKELETDTALMNKIYGFYDDEITDEEQPTKPYIFLQIVSDVPDPIESRVRLEFRIIANNENTTKAQIREIDNMIVSILPDKHSFNSEFFTTNIVVEDWFETIEGKKRVGFIRDFLFYFIN